MPPNAPGGALAQAAQFPPGIPNGLPRIFVRAINGGKPTSSAERSAKSARFIATDRRQKAAARKQRIASRSIGHRLVRTTAPRTRSRERHSPGCARRSSTSRTRGGDSPGEPPGRPERRLTRLQSSRAERRGAL
jgi:hypothetical protein